MALARRESCKLWCCLSCINGVDARRACKPFTEQPELLHVHKWVFTCCRLNLPGSILRSWWMLSCGMHSCPVQCLQLPLQSQPFVSHCSLLQTFCGMPVIFNSAVPET